MLIGIIGINHKLADLKLRELLAQACQRLFGGEGLTKTHPSDHSFVLLSTCNRTEIYFSSHELSAAHSYLLEKLRSDVHQEFDQKLYTYFGKDCLRHLVRVTAGLDSAILAETEIQGQVRHAYETAATHHSLPHELHFLFQKALKIGKQVRAELPMGRGRPHLAEGVLQVATTFFTCPSQARLLLIGASEINLKILAILQRKGFKRIALCNRSAPTAKALAQRHSLDFLPWEQLVNWPLYDWVICGTKAPKPILLPEHLSVWPQQRSLLIDLSVPRNIDPQVSLSSERTLLNIDDINHRLKSRSLELATQLEHAERLIEESTLRQVALFEERDLRRQLRLVVA